MAEMSEEHVWPRSLGGHLADDAFVIDVCDGCNSTCGLFVDAQFTKSWFVTNEMANDAFAYIDLDRGTPLPLIYMGEVRELNPSPHAVADLWLSHCRSPILHVHSNTGDKWVGYAGGNIQDRKANPGAAIFLNAADDERWVRLGLRSFLQKFEVERRMVYGVTFATEADTRTFGGPPDSTYQAIVDAYLGLDQPKRPTPCNISIRMDYDQRFMAKVALGLGFKHLGESFLDTTWASLLRQTLWAKTVAEQDRLRSIGSGGFDKSDEALHRVLKWDGGITIALLPAGPRLGLLFRVFGRSYSVIVSDDPGVWSRCGGLGHGLVWVIIPQREFSEGPIPMIDFVSHQQGHTAIPALAEAATWRVDPRTIRRSAERASDAT